MQFKAKINKLQLSCLYNSKFFKKCINKEIDFCLLAHFFFFYVSKVLGAMEAQESMPTLRINIMKSCNGSLTTLCQKPAVQHKGILLCLSTALLVTKNLTRGKCSQAPCNKPCPIQLLQTSSGS